METNGSGPSPRCHRDRPFNRDLMDRLVLPGALGFTRFGYALKKRSWTSLPRFSEERVAVVTGATSGLGRTGEKLAKAVEEIGAATGSDSLQAELADLSLKADVRNLADRLLRREDAIHILVNNAAVLPSERRLTPEGFETAFATDLLSPFLLTRLLLPQMRS